MIHYDLQCANGHEFDGWFASSDAYDAQAAKGLVDCTHCGSTKVEKQVMAPGIPAKSNRKSNTAMPMTTGAGDPRYGEMMRMMRDYKKHVESHSEDVGANFAEEARKIHYKEAEDRGIRGQATGEEAKALREEGIAVHPLPVLPEEAN